MKIFISYAHVDEYRVRELVDILRDSEHDPWFDHRLTVGRAWEDQLLEAIRVCDRFLYALTPESVESKWCQWEFAQAVHAGRPIVPVLVQDKTPLTGALSSLQYADFSKGPTPRGVAKLLAGVNNAQTLDPGDVPVLPPPHAKPERPVESDKVNAPLADQLYGDAYTLFRAKDYAEAQELLHDCLLIDSHHAEAQKLLVLVERRRKNEAVVTQSLAASPAPLARPGTRVILPPPFEWIEIPAGKVTLEAGGYLERETTFDVPGFWIAKYPTTNAQYAKFVEAGGYREPKWWTDAGWEARKQGIAWSSKDSAWKPTGTPWTEPSYWQDKQWNGADYPVVGVSWHEAIAFCQWLSEITGENVLLPTEQQWQRAAQGDDGRTYPWGNEEPNEQLCNFAMNIGHTTPVTQYPKGASPYGVLDMSGNVWEWCLTGYESGSVSLDGTARQVSRGGAWLDTQDYARAVYRYCGIPNARYLGCGFRVVRPPSL